MNIFTSKATGLLAIVAVLAVAFMASVAFAPIAEAQSYTFAVNMKQGSSGVDVLNLQKVLNMNAATQIASSGVGSPGNETSYFGGLTKAAVIKFQNLYASEILAPVGLSSGTGFVGASTRAKLNATSGGTTGGSTSSVPGCTSTSGYSPTTGQKCDSGVSTVPSTGGALQVTAGSQPANALAVESASRVPFTRVVLTAGSNPVTVNSLTVERTGPSSNSVFSGVVLLDENGNQIGTAKTLNSNNQVAIGEAITIPAGSSRTLTVAGNMTATLDTYAGMVVGLNVVGVNTSGTVSGSLPVSGALHTVNATLAIGTATVAVSSFDPNSAASKEIGTTNYKIAGVRVTAGSAEQVRLRSVRWNQTGSAGTSDLVNVTTYVDGVAYPTTVDTTGKYYTANFGSGIVLDKGLAKDVYVQTDIVGANASGRSVQFDINKSADVYVTGETYGYGITVTAGSTGAASTGSEFTTTGSPFFSGSTITVTGGSVTTVTRANSVPAQNVAVNVANQVLGGYEIDLRGEAISVQQQVFYITSSVDATAILLTGVGLYGPNGNLVAGPADAVDVAGTNQKVTFGDTVTYPIGKGVYTLKGKILTGTANNVTFQASTTPSTDWSTVTGQTTGNTVSLSSLSSAVQMNTVTVKGAALAVAQSATPAAATVVAGTNNMTFANIQLDATQSGDDVRLSTLPITIGGTGTATKLTSCQMFDGATALNSTVVNPSAATASFNFDQALTISKGSVKTIAVKCNVAADATGTFTVSITSGQVAALTVTGVNSGASVTATGSGSGTTQTIGTGSLVVSTSPSSPAYKLVAAGATNETVGVYRFRASNEAATLKNLGLKLTNTASSSPADLISVTIWDGATQVGSATFVGANTVATSTDMTVALPKDADKDLTIKASFAQIGTGQTGTQGALIAIDFNATDTAGTKATGESGTDITESGSTAVSGVRLFKSYPVVAADSSIGTTGVVDGKLMRFRVTANANGGVGLNQLKFTMATTSVTVTAVNLFGYTDSSYSSPISTFTSGQISASNVSPGTSGAVTITPSAVINIPAGTTYYFELRGTAVAGATTYAVTTTLSGDSSYPSLAAHMGTSAGVVSASGNFVWSPNATTTSAAAHVDWTNGYGVSGLPSSGLTQTRSN